MVLIISRLWSILCLDRILALEHVIDLGEIVCSGDDGLGVSSRREVFLQVSMLAEETHLFKQVSNGKREEILKCGDIPHRTPPERQYAEHRVCFASPISWPSR